MQEYKFKAKPSFYIIWFLGLSIFTAPLFLAYLKNPNYIEMLIFPLVIYLGIFIIIRFFTIEIKNGKILYRRLFSFKKEICIKNIEELTISVGMHINGVDEFTTFHLLIKGQGKKLVINLKPFSYEDISVLIKTILVENKNVKVDKFLEDAKNGNFESIKKERKSNLIFAIIFILSIFLITYLSRNF